MESYLQFFCKWLYGYMVKWVMGDNGWEIIILCIAKTSFYFVKLNLQVMF